MRYIFILICLILLATAVSISLTFLIIMQNLSRCRPPKTTVKRILLQEDSKKASNSKSLFRMDEQYLNVQQRESTAIPSSFTDKSARPTSGSKNQGKPTCLLNENQYPTIYFILYLHMKTTCV